MSDRYAVVGNPVGHTKSPAIHRAFAAATGQDLEYVAIEAPLGGFAAAADAHFGAGGLGLNVTVPFKLDACAYATELGEAARLAGAVNALKREGGRVVGENFDGVGLVRDIVVNLGQALRGRRVLLLGSGGASRGAIQPFLAERPARLVVAGRRLEAAAVLAAMGGMAGVEALDYPALEREGGFDVVVNATSASLSGELPPIAAGCFAPRCLAYELAYGKGLTPFLRLAREAGAAQLVDGVGMLVEQAAEAFAWWRGVRPLTAPVIAALTVPLV